MAKTKVIPALRSQSAKNFLENLSIAGNTYMFVGKPTAWDNDNVPPGVTGSVSEHHSAYHNMLGVESIPSGDIRFMIKKNQWIASTVYDIYRHDYDVNNLSYSGAAYLEDCKYVVINSANNVYICLDNNANTASLIEPTSTSSVPFTTSDGYQWLYMYSLSSADIADYASSNHIPVDQLNATSLTSGAIYTAILNSGGADYTITPSGGLNQTNEYFVNVRGDGTGAVAKLSIVAGSVTSVDIVRNGQNYTFATIPFTSGECFGSIEDLDEAQNSLNPEGNGLFDATVIIQPAGGFRSDIITDVSCRSIGVFGSLNYSSFSKIDSTSFRQIGILHKPSFVGGGLPADANTTFGVLGSMTGNTGDFQVGEIIEQDLTNGTTARGVVVGISEDVVINDDTGETADVVRYLQIPGLNEDTDGNIYEFSGTTPIVGATTDATMTVNSLVSGSYDGMTFFNGHSDPDILQGTGDIIYLTNLVPVNRADNQEEKVSCIINF